MKCVFAVVGAMGDKIEMTKVGKTSFSSKTKRKRKMAFGQICLPVLFINEEAELN